MSVLRKSVTGLALAGISLSVAMPAFSEEFSTGAPFYRHHRVETVISGGGNGVPVILPGIGTYAGNVSALSVRGHGIYFFVDGLRGTSDAVQPMTNGKAKIIDLSNMDSACHMENGVCIIRQ